VSVRICVVLFAVLDGVIARLGLRLSGPVLPEAADFEFLHDADAIAAAVARKKGIGIVESRLDGGVGDPCGGIGRITARALSVAWIKNELHRDIDVDEAVGSSGGEKTARPAEKDEQ
jgi:hypothetical protein